MIFDYWISQTDGSLAVPAHKLMRMLFAEAEASLVALNKNENTIVLKKKRAQELVRNYEDREISDDNLRKRIAQINRAILSSPSNGTPRLSIKSRSSNLLIVLDEGYQEFVARLEISRELSQSTDEDSHVSEERIVTPEVTKRRAFTVFVSHAWEDQQIEEIVDDFVLKLRTKLSHLPQRFQSLFSIDLWFDRDRMDSISGFQEQTDAACQQATTAIFLISNKWIASNPCQREARHFCDEFGKPIDGKNFLLCQLNGHRIEQAASFAERPRFPEIFDGSKNLLDFWCSATVSQKDEFLSRIRDDVCSWILQNKTHYLTSKVETETFAPYVDENFEKEVQLGTTETPFVSHREGEGERLEVLPLLEDWATNPHSTHRVSALLGSFGSGKTTTTQLLAQRLGRKYQSNKNSTFPIYMDLRRLVGFVEPGQSVANLELGHLLKASLNSTIQQELNERHLVEFLRNTNCTILFDGLDEVGTRIGVPATSSLFRQLLEVVPKRAWEADKTAGRANWNACQTRVMVTCRSHFFKDHFEETSALIGHHRHELSDFLGSRLFQRFYMAPFTREQVGLYLEKQLGPVKGKAALSTISKLPDLVGLSSKPLMARLIVERLPNIVAEYSQRDRVSISTIYKFLFRSGLARDQEKQLLLSEHDREWLLEELALKLWQEERASIQVDFLDDWFEQKIFERPGLQAIIGSHLLARNLLKTELHNASFMTRVGDDSFVFAHTSFFEYFLAKSLLKRFQDGSILNMRTFKSVSEVTIEFFHDGLANLPVGEKIKYATQIEALAQTHYSKSANEFAYSLSRHRSS